MSSSASRCSPVGCCSGRQVNRAGGRDARGPRERPGHARRCATDSGAGPSPRALAGAVGRADLLRRVVPLFVTSPKTHWVAIASAWGRGRSSWSTWWSKGIDLRLPAPTRRQDRRGDHRAHVSVLPDPRRLQRLGGPGRGPSGARRPVAAGHVGVAALRRPTRQGCCVRGRCRCHRVARRLSGRAPVRSPICHRRRRPLVGSRHPHHKWGTATSFPTQPLDAAPAW